MMKKMRKTFILLVMVISSLIIIRLNCNKIYAAEKEYVYDDADLLDEEEENTLNAKCKEASDECEIDISIATTDNANGKTSQKYAEDFILEKNIGYEYDDRFDKSAVLFLVDLDNNETYIATTGMGILCVEDSDIENILDNIYEYIKSDYYKAFDTFVNSTVRVINGNIKDYASEYRDEWETYDGSYEDFQNEYVNKKEPLFHKLRNPLISFVIAVVIGLIAVAVMALNNRAKMTASGDTYMNRNEIKFHINSDRYINTTTTKIKINNDSNGGGGHGGSSHSGSGGHSFGGGGRSL